MIGREPGVNAAYNALNGKDGSVQITHVRDAGPKDKFFGIKSATAADVMVAHRVPPQLLGIVSAQGSLFGNLTDATAMF